MIKKLPSFFKTQFSYSVSVVDCNQPAQRFKNDLKAFIGLFTQRFELMPQLFIDFRGHS